MIKSWYINVRQETMAPARMVSFMEQHAATCEVCLRDPDLKYEMTKITEMVLPESKIPKAIRQNNFDEEDEEENLDGEEEELDEDEFLEEDDGEDDV